MIIKLAKDLKVNDRIYERDGFEFKVSQIERNGNQLTISVHSDFASVQPKPLNVNRNTKIVCG